MKNISIKATYVVYACYILSAIMVFYTLLSIFNIHQYIQSLIDANQLIVSQQLFKVFITYLDSSLPSLCVMHSYCLPLVFYSKNAMKPAGIYSSTSRLWKRKRSRKRWRMRMISMHI
ncbi:MAG: hypothetical protein ACLRS2_09100 [[Clostridium] innocuum]